MNFLLDVERRRMHHEVGPVLLILAAPDQLRVQVAVAALVGHADGALRLLLHHGLIFSGRNVLASSLLVRECSDSLGVLGSPCHVMRSTFQKRVLDGEAFDALTMLQILAVESGAAGIQSGSKNQSVVEAVAVAGLNVEGAMVERNAGGDLEQRRQDSFQI